MTAVKKPPAVAILAVCGAGSCDPETAALAEAVGREIARRGAILACGGLGGVMEAAARGAKAAGGMTLGILPGLDRREANAFIDVPITTGLAEGRNLVLVRTADAVIALAGEYGTLSEIALALKIGKPVVSLQSWEIGPEVVRAEDAADAVAKALKACGRRGGSRS